MTNEELTTQVLRYCSLGEVPDICMSENGEELTPSLFYTNGCYDLGDLCKWSLSLKDCTIKLHHPDKWREVIPENEQEGVNNYLISLRKYRIFTSLVNEINKRCSDRLHIVNDLLYKYNIALDANWEQHENIRLI